MFSCNENNSKNIVTYVKLSLVTYNNLTNNHLVNDDV